MGRSAQVGETQASIALRSEATSERGVMTFIDFFAWLVFVLLVAILAAVFIALGMMPGQIARKRGHPWAEAVTVGGWATLICGFVFWPLVLIWAYVDVPAKRETTP